MNRNSSTPLFGEEVWPESMLSHFHFFSLYCHPLFVSLSFHTFPYILFLPSHSSSRMRK